MSDGISVIDMALHRIRRGLDLPISGAPATFLEDAPPVGEVALLGADYPGLRPKIEVQPGNFVRRGDPLFHDKRHPRVCFTAPAAGRIAAIHRGAKRRFESLVLDLSEAERAGEGQDAEQAAFHTFSGRHPRDLERESIIGLLVESGEWTALRRRPFSTVADPEASPASIFVTAIDTQPLAPPMQGMLEGRQDDLERGLHAVGRLTDGPVWVCTDATTAIALPDTDQFRLVGFSGPHPSGTVGLHIHRLDPVDQERFVWHIGLQDLLAVGALFRTGRLDVTRQVALSGPAVARPRLLRTRRGARLETLCAGEMKDGELRVLSGSVLSGRRAMGDVHGFLGRYHQQICAIQEQRERDFLGWMAPGRRKYSASFTFISRILGRRTFDLGSSTGGSPRAIVPVGLYEQVFPMDMEPTFLLKALMMRDTEWAERLGCLELDEEDLALCAFVCPGKSDFGAGLREILDALEREYA